MGFAVSSELDYWNVDSVTIRAGCGYALSGGVTSGQPSAVRCGADARPDGVAAADTSPNSLGIGWQIGCGNFQVRLAAGASVSGPGVRLRVANSSGEWEVAPAAALNPCAMSAESAAAGAMCWAMPVGVSPLASYISTTSVQVAADVSTTSATFVDIPGASLTIVAGAAEIFEVYANFGTNSNSTVGADTFIIALVDGVQVAVSPQSNPGLVSYSSSGSLQSKPTAVSAGSRTVKLQWRTTAGTVRSRCATLPQQESIVLSVRRLRA